jgi:hypothetical protein
MPATWQARLRRWRSSASALHANAGGNSPLAGVLGISVVERLKTRYLQLTVRGVTWTPFLLPRLYGDLPPGTVQQLPLLLLLPRLHPYRGGQARAALSIRHVTSRLRPPTDEPFHSPLKPFPKNLSSRLSLYASVQLSTRQMTTKSASSGIVWNYVACKQ